MICQANDLSVEKMRRTFSESPNSRSESSLAMVQSTLSKPLEDSDDITSPHSSNHSTQIQRRKRKRKSSIVESPVTVRNLISNTRSDSSETDSLNMNSSQTSQVDSIGNDQASRGFWNRQCTELSKKLWLPTEIELQDSEWNWSNGYYKGTEHGSWFLMREWEVKKKNWSTISSPLSTSSQRELMEQDRIPEKEKKMATSKKNEKKEKEKEKKSKQIRQSKKPKVTRSRTLRLHPSKPMARILDMWLGAHRRLYNDALALSRSTTDNSVRYNESYLRKRLVTNTKLDWLRSVPSKIRNEAVSDLCKSFWSNMAKKKKNPNHTFKLSFKKKKSRKQSFNVPGESMTFSDGYVVFFKRLSKKCVSEYIHGREEFFKDPEEYAKIRVHTRHLNTDIIRDSTVTKKNGKFYLHIPVDDSQVKVRNQKRESRGSAAIDPGVKNFVTTYSPEGTSYMVSGYDKLRSIDKGISKMQHLLEEEMKRVKQSKNKKKFKAKMRVLRLARACRKAHEKMTNMVKDMHWKVARLLCEENHTIYLPMFETSQMSRKCQDRRRTISKCVSNSMLRQSHFLFRQRLLMKAKDFDTEVILVKEDYTTKSCTRCGELNEDVGGSRVFSCPSCAFRGHRDGCAGRNIYIKSYLGL